MFLHICYNYAITSLTAESESDTLCCIDATMMLRLTPQLLIIQVSCVFEVPECDFDLKFLSVIFA